MEAFEVLTNLKSFDCWEFKSYSMSKAEADAIIKELDKPKGNWKHSGILKGVYSCSLCNCLANIPHQFCPACGSRMEGRE